MIIENLQSCKILQAKEPKACALCGKTIPVGEQYIVWDSRKITCLEMSCYSLDNSSGKAN